jgi:hypothetical protein
MNRLRKKSRNNPTHNRLKKTPSINLMKEVKDSYMKTVKHWRQKLKKIPENESLPTFMDWQN